MDPVDVKNPLLKDMTIELSEKCRCFSDKINIHDLRVVPGPTHTNIIFDVVIPPELFTKKDEVCAELQQCISAMNENYFAVITAELSYCG